MIDEVIGAQGLARLPIEDSDIHIWHTSLSMPPSDIALLERMLSPDERERADRYVVPRDRARFIGGRAMLRQILSSYTDASPDELLFTYNAHGKPELQHAEDIDIRFNVSHQDNHLYIGIGIGHSIGIDVDSVREIPDLMLLAERFFQRHEVEMLQALAADDQLYAFFRIWTRTEAILKAVGVGIPALQSKTPVRRQDFMLYDIDAPHNYLAAVAVEGTFNRIIWRRL